MEMKARILGVAAQMGEFDFYFGVSFGKLISSIVITWMERCRLGTFEQLQDSK